MMKNSDLLQLLLLVFAAVTFVVIGDTAGKLLTGGGLDPAFVAWTRFGLSCLFLLPFSGLTWREAPALVDRRVVLRALFIVGGVSCILTALQTEPIANVFGAFFIGPIVSYLLAVLILGETPSPARSGLLALGFAGVMLVVKPGFGFSMGMGFALAAGVFYGAYLAMTRAIAGAHRGRFLLLSQLLIGSLVLTPVGVAAAPTDLSLQLALLILLSAFGSTCGNYLLVIANQKAEASLIAPLVYTQLISATLLGGLVFREWPDAVALLGLALIMTSGLGSLALARR